MKKEFNWGKTPQSFIDCVSKEIFEDNCYQTVYPVKPGDVVMDIGASVGPFSWSVKDKASKIIAVEPSKEAASTLRENLKGYNAHIIEKALGKEEGVEETIFALNEGENSNQLNYTPKAVETIPFKSIVEQHNLNRIDFIKTDCEGGEYNLFTDANMPYLLNNVRNIVGEFHLSSDFPELKVEFRYFRDKYLKQFPNFEVYSIDGVNIKWDLWNDHFIEYYNMVNIHISNDA